MDKSGKQAKTPVPILDLKAQYAQVGEAMEKGALEVLRSGAYILGQKGAQLEREVAELCGAKYGIAVANGTDALILAVWALDLGPGDEVITTPFTFAATAEAISIRGAKPVFVDIDPVTFNIDVDLVARAITPRTKAILPVHLYGQPADMDPLKALAERFGLKIIEDNAQAIGASYKGRQTGALGDLACISFYPTKNLGAAGDAGMIVTNDEKLNDRLRVLRAHGSKVRYYHDEMGVNSRLDEIQAAILLAKMPYIKEWNLKRAAVADLYNQMLADCQYVITPAKAADRTHVWHQYTIRVSNSQSGNSTLRDDLVKELAARGISTMCYYPVPMHKQPAFKYLNHKDGDFPQAEKVCQEVISLPMYPELSKEQVRQVTTELKEAVAALTTPMGQVISSPTNSGRF